MQSTLLSLTLFCTSWPLVAQEISLAEALDTSGINWESVAGPLGTQDPNNPLVLTDENQWHGVSNGSYDGVDALYVTMPTGNGSYTSLTADIQGPVRVSWWYKATPNEGSNLHYFGAFNGSGLIHDNAWHQVTETLRETQTLKLNINVNGNGTSPPLEAWLDRFEVDRSFPPDLIDLPDHVPVPVGKTAKLEVTVEGVGNISYKWFKEGTEMPGETQATIPLPAQSMIGEVEYKVEVTDELGTTLSPPIRVEYYSLSDALDNETLVFTVPDSPSQSYQDMLLLGEEAFDGEDAIYLRRSRKGNPPQSEILTVVSIATEVEGPTILSYYDTFRIKILVDGQIPLYWNDQGGDGWGINTVIIPEPGNHTVEWQMAGDFEPYAQGASLDQVSISQAPLLNIGPTDTNTVVGTTRILKYEFINLGQTTHQLIKDGDVVLESIGGPISMEELEVDEDGIYQLRLINEFEEEVVSDPFEITIHDTIGEAVEQPDLDWTYEGENIWIPQIFDTYDGEDAAGRLNEIIEPGTVSTQVTGPALVSFWWKNGSSFHVNESEIILHYQGTGWQKAEFALTKQTNTLTWQNGLFDQLHIDYVDPIGEAVEQPDLLWTFTGNRVWIPQAEDTYDGQDAAVLVDDGSGDGTVYTDIPGPAIISFWWKDGGTFTANSDSISYAGEGWQQVQMAVLNPTNRLTWNAGYLDQLQIEDISNDPFRQWAFSLFDSDEVIENLDEIMSGDRDFDALSNLLEWALNKNIDFPNKPISYTIVEEEGEQYLGILYSRRGDLGTYNVHLEASSDLQTWERSESVVSETYHPSNDAYTQLVRDIQSMDTGPRFIRLVVSDAE